MIRLRHSYLLLIVLVLSFQIKAQDGSVKSNVFVPEINEPVQPLQQFLQIKEDKEGKLQIADFIQNKVSDTTFHKANTLQHPDPYNTWWCKINIQPTFSSNNFLIGVPFDASSGLDNGNDIADVWIIKKNQVVHQYHTGNLNPVSQRPVGTPINQNLFPVALQKGEPLTIYWRIQRTKFFAPPQFHFTLQHKDIVTSSSHIIKYKVAGYTALAYLGIMSILFFFGLVFFLITRQKPFVWFTVMAACLGLHIMLLHPANYLTQWLFAEHPVLQFHAFFGFIGLFNISILMFIRAFVNTRKLVPLWDKIVLAVILFIACITLSSIIFLETNPRFQLSFFITLLAFISLLIIGSRLVFVKNLYAQWMGGALLWLFSFQFLGILWNNKILPEWFFNPWIIAQVGMMIIIFFALAYRFKQSAKEKAEAEKVMEMDKIKSRFFANISHEFRTPLTLIQGPLQQIEETIPDVQKQTGTVNVPWRQLKTMRRHTDRLLELVNQLLDLSKLDSGKMKLQVIKGDVLQMLKVLTSSFESIAERKKIHFHTHFPEQTTIAFFDKDKLDKIVCNLLGNAFKYTPEQGTVSVIIEAEEGRLRISVEDSGFGIAKKELDKVFDRFYQVEGTEDKGSGIGLALVKELVDLYRGQLSVSSEPGKGSRFRVSLPIEKNGFKENEIVYGEWKNDPQLFNSRQPEEKNHTDKISVKVGQELPLLLVVEDNSDLRQFIIESVQPHYSIIEASN